ncbi:LLM class flavin-dependent oxidoreductase [Streptomyces hirsutus]|uniref:LLM class flavin-dependent oxidoreductase n=1 Tax=Streptomyces hirsutus TaxID=35620 RepID=UPI0034127EB1
MVHPVGRGSAPPNPDGPQRSHSPGTAVLDERTPLADPLAALAAVAGAAGTTGPATAVPVAVLRRPHLGARAVATLHEVSGGRLRPGAGAGRPQGEFAALGAPFATRGRDLDDEIAVLRRVFAGGPFDDRPDRWAFDPVRVSAAAPGGVVIVGGSPSAALCRAAAAADGWIVSGAPWRAEAARAKAAIGEIRQVPGRNGPFVYIARVDAVDHGLDAVDHGQVAEFATKGFDEAIVWADRLRRAGAVNERRHALTEALSHMRCARDHRHAGVASIYRYEFLRECPRRASGPGGGTSDKVQANRRVSGHEEQGDVRKR